ncbi:hypothetical protein JTB14_014464 [Gonioctena quinquepunctata]|nr:hypothetical protein JTB14_014464 [Gonioctena quinquepunctata]
MTIVDENQDLGTSGMLLLSKLAPSINLELYQREEDLKATETTEIGGNQPITEEINFEPFTQNDPPRIIETTTQVYQVHLAHRRNRENK